MDIFVPHIVRVRVAGARQVSIIGDFNNWHSNAHPLIEVREGEWQRLIDLPADKTGREHSYAFFVIDGTGVAHESVRSRIIAGGNGSWVPERTDHAFSIVAHPELNRDAGGVSERRVA